MRCLLLGFGLVAWWFFWGLGPALWVLPAGWRRFLGVISLPFGLALQIGLVWWLTPLLGPVSSFAPWLNVIPALLLFAALKRRRNRRWLRAVLLSRSFAIAGVLTATGLLVALVPLASSPHNTLGLTTISIGSRDGPDYALGARFFLEVGKGTPGQYWGQYEQVEFERFWQRFNHFGAAALLATAAATFNLEIWQLLTVLACALGAGGASLALVFGERVLGFRPWLAVIGGFLYALSPFWVHGAYNTSVGQLVGTLGAGAFLLLALSLPLSRGFLPWLQKVVAGALTLWLLVSSYSMMIFFVVAILGVVAVGRAWLGRKWRFLGAAILWAVAVGGLCTLWFPQRALAVVAMAMAYGAGGDGWPMSPMLLSSLFGVNLSHFLAPRNYPLHIAACGALALLWAGGIAMAWRRRDRALVVVIAVCGVILGAAQLLVLKDPDDQLRNTYKVYKLMAVFLPLLLPSLLVGLNGYLGRRLHRLGVVLLTVILTVSLPVSIYSMGHAARAMPLRVTAGAIALAPYEKMASPASVNISTEEAWDTLWTTAFLARKELHFAYGTYGHASGPLTGEWTFERSFRGFYPATALQLGNGLVLRPSNDPARLQLTLGIGWWDDEGTHRWSGSRGRFFSFFLEAPEAISGVTLILDGEYMVPGTKVQAMIGDRELPVYQSRRGNIVVANFDVEAGVSELRFRADRQPIRGKTAEDDRMLLLNVREIEIMVDGESVARPRDPAPGVTTPQSNTAGDDNAARQP